MVSGGRTVRRSRLGAALAGLVLALGAPVASAAPFAYVANLNSSSVSQFDAGAGPLAPLTPPTIGAGEFPQDVAVSPDGASVYVANASNVLSANTVAQFSIAANGSLVPKSPPSVPAGNTPTRIAVRPDGASLYVTNTLEGTVSQYSVTTGSTLVPKAPPTVAAGIQPGGIAITPEGSSVYLADAVGQTVLQYSVGAGGALSPRTPAAVVTGAGPLRV